MKPLISKINNKGVNTASGNIKVSLPVLSTSAATIEFWVKPNAAIVTTAFLGNSTVGTNNLYFNASSIGTYRIFYSGSLRAIGSTPNPAVQVQNQWIHIACAFNAGTLKTYVNGVIANTITGTIYDIPSDFWIGYVSQSTQGSDNTFDEVRIWNYTRTDAQIAEYYDKILKPQTGLVAYYKLDDNILDSSGNGYDGVVSGTITYTTDVAPQLEKFKFLSTDGYGSAVYGTGENDYIQTDVSYGNQNSFTMMAWVKTSNVPKDQIFLSNASGTYFRLSGSRPFYSINATTQLTYSVTPTQLSSLVADKWYHMTMTFNGTTVVYYLDGVVVATIAATGSYVVIGNLKFRLGRFSDGDPRSLEGGLANVQFWSKALTQQEINTYRFQIPKADTTGLLGCFPLIKDASEIKGMATTNNGVTFSKDTPYKRILTTDN